MTRITILRCEKLPSFVTWELPNLDELFEEDNLLLQCNPLLSPASASRRSQGSGSDNVPNKGIFLQVEAQTLFDNFKVTSLP